MAQFKKRTETNTIFVHCSATKPSQDIGARQIRIWHKHGKGWLDIGYHLVIKRDGTVEEGRPLDVVGAHAFGHNGDSVAVCLVGGIDEKGEADSNFTSEQYESLKTVIKSLKGKYENATIKGHRDVSYKDCPSFDVHGFIENFA